MEIDLSKVAPEDLPRVKQLLAEVAEHEKYATHLAKFLDQAYEWQKQVVRFTKDKTVIGTISANRVGKTENGCAIIAQHLTGHYAPWYEGKKFKKPVKVIAACLNSDLNKTVLQAKLFGTSNWRVKKQIGTAMIPKDLVDLKSAVSARGDGVERINIHHKSGGSSELYFRAYSQGREAAQGVEADVILIDEQPKDDFWEECLTRLATTGGHVICSFTPLEGRTGLVATLLDLPPVPDAPEDKFGAKVRADKSWSMVRASWDDITHIPEDQKETLKKGYAEYSRDARTYGIPISGHGRVFPFHKGEITYSESETRVPDTLPHLVGIDIGHGFGRDPSAAFQVAWDEDKDIVYVTRGKQESTDTTRDLARLIVWTDHESPVAWPNDANKSSMNADSTVSQQLRSMDINLLGKPFLNPKGADGKVNNWKMPGIKEMAQRFSDGRLKISERYCNDLLKQIEEYSYDVNGRLKDGNDHCVDAVRYAIMSIIQGYGQPLNIPNKFDDAGFDDDEFEYNII